MVFCVYICLPSVAGFFCNVKAFSDFIQKKGMVSDMNKELRTKAYNTIKNAGTTVSSYALVSSFLNGNFIISSGFSISFLSHIN